MKKILKISLFIIVFCLLLILFSNSKVQAVVETITTVQELQKVMGATEYSTIDGTTLKITDNFTWTLTDDVYIKITELIIDFNGKEIKIENSTTNKGINIIEGKVTLKDSQGETGGIYCSGHFIDLDYNTELVIENGQYIANGELFQNNGVIQNNGGLITINNGIFKCMELYDLFQICSGKIIINNGNFEGKGGIINLTRHSSQEEISSELVINDGKFTGNGASVLELYQGANKLNVKLNGGEFYSSKACAILLSHLAHTGDDPTNDAILYLDGCEISSDTSCLQFLYPVGDWNISIVNCSMSVVNPWTSCRSNLC